MFYGFRYSSDRCVTPDVAVCKYYLGLVPHGSLAQHWDLGSCLFLQTFDGVTLRSQNLPHEIELTEMQNQGGKKIDVRAKTDTNSKPRRAYRHDHFHSLKKVKSFVAPDTTKTKSGSILGTTGQYRPDYCIILIWCSRWESSCRYYFRLTSWGRNLREVWFIREVNKSPKCCAKCFKKRQHRSGWLQIMQINSTWKWRFMKIDINISLKDKFHLHSTRCNLV